MLAASRPTGTRGVCLLIHTYSSLKMTSNTGAEAIVQVQEGPIKTVYLKRLVRQDETGIWTVVGYDPR